jgi:protocatechuate 3,4-dioxygenase, beta subunit
MRGGPVHIHFSLVGAGLAQRLITQMYFPGDPLLALNPIFQSTVDETARDRLIARQDSGTAGMSGEWRLDLRLRGEGKTVFLEV